MLLLLPEEIWRPETSSLLKFLYMGVQKKNSTAEKYLQFLNQGSNMQSSNLGMKYKATHVLQSKTMGSALHFKSALLHSGLYCDVVSAIDLLTREASS